MDSKRELNWFYVACCCILASYFMGYLGRGSQIQEVVKTQVVVEEKIQTVAVKEQVVVEREVVKWKDRVETKVRTERKPDGTEITESSTTSTTSGSSTSSQEYTRKELVSSERYQLSKATTEEIKTSSLPRYSVTVLINPLDIGSTKKWLPTLQVGARLGDLPIYLVGGFDFSTNEAQVGITLEF